MGLPLHNPLAPSPFLPSETSLQPDLLSTRHFPHPSDAPPGRTRHAARPFHWSPNKLSQITCRTIDAAHAQLPGSLDFKPEDSSIPAHHIAALRHEVRAGHRLKRLNCAVPRYELGRKRVGRARGWGTCEEDEEGLARCKEVRLPIDRDRARVSVWPGMKREWDGGDAAEVGELYRMGILYDDEDERETGSGFGMDVVERRPDEMYPYKVRWAKRRRGRKAWEKMDTSWAADLPFGVWYEGLRGEEAYVAWLLAPEESEVVEQPENTLGVDARSSSLDVAATAEADLEEPASKELDDTWSIVSDVWDRPFPDITSPEPAKYAADAGISPDPDPWIVIAGPTT